MQRTRLNTLVTISQNRLNQLFTNPWRRISLSLISFLLGFFVAQAISTTAGQKGYWDIFTASFLLFFTESASIIVYGRRQQKIRPLGLDSLNLFKAGMIYGLFLQALIVGS
ncbi:DUF565 domain-containing protein [Aphanothece sacrum]|uniref:DUF565 domain-containing protein n=1 Tax=Aphanothece sacrum FPU1 TaxID=1920663 RepID=A0A401IKA0_APHSA|nr:DUF565 domain-containing protein [Aphanothece sacrum]GBF81600.1 hypothetical protein AsFPU1_3018 [Aphanothece sacrum FPU1]GBF84142.1 hypothetical protein AsFPU3_1188 [Aphanothece sacrum FPU3]